jgi:hypothetical protein
MMTSWNDWQNDALTIRLREHIDACLSSSQIAAELNHEFKTSLTRNAIIGRARRLGLHIKGSQAQRKPRAPRHRPQRSQTLQPYKPQKALPRVTASLVEKVVREQNHEEDVVIQQPGMMDLPEIKHEESNLIPFIETRAGLCKWPVGDLFCGAPCDNLRQPYCRVHTFVSTQGLDKLKRSTIVEEHANQRSNTYGTS